MKNILSILLFLFLFNCVSISQSYHKFINDTLYWDVSFADMEYICWGYSDYGPWRYAIVGDTIINDTSYSKFISYNFIPIYPTIDKQKDCQNEQSVTELTKHIFAAHCKPVFELHFPSSYAINIFQRFI